MRGWRATSLTAGSAVLAVGTAAAAALALWQLAPGSNAPQVLPLAQPHFARAAELLNGARRNDPAALAEAEAEARRALADSPARADAWLALAWVDQARAKRFGPDAAEALERSYLVGPFDPDLGVFRVEFCFDRWSLLPKGLRDDALRELAALWSRTDMREDLRKLAARIEDPAGRMAYAIQLALLERSRDLGPTAGG